MPDKDCVSTMYLFRSPHKLNLGACAQNYGQKKSDRKNYYFLFWQNDFSEKT